MAEKRGFLQVLTSGDTQRNTKEAVTREQSLRHSLLLAKNELMQTNGQPTVWFGLPKKL